jgi:hypothetical protein
MPVSSSSVPWVGSLLWLVALTVVSFLVSWIAANRLQVRRTPYVGVLTAATAVMLFGYLAWSGLGFVDMLTARWAWGLVAAPLSAVFLVVGMTRLPVFRRLTGRELGIAVIWEGLVYGVAEGVLLSVLPALMTWQLVHSLGWSGIGGGIARWTLPIVASVVVIVVHHLGYWEYRNRLLGPIAVGCGLLTLGFLATGSVIAPSLGHVLGHGSGLLHGAELPPHQHTAQPLSPDVASTSADLA